MIKKPDVKAAWLKQGAIPMVKTPEEFDAYLRKDIEKWAHVVKSLRSEGEAVTDAMTGTGSGWLSGLLTAPVALAIVATLAALVLALLVAVPREVRLRALSRSIGFGLVLAALAVLIDRLSADRAGGRAARAARARRLRSSAPRWRPARRSPVSMARPGDAVENACEKAVFGSAAKRRRRRRLYGGAAAAARRRGAYARPAGRRRACRQPRRAIELDRFGIAAHVLAARDGCTAERCAAFALLDDTDALKANLKAQVFEQYVSRYAEAWNKRRAEKQPALSALPAPAPAMRRPPKAPQPLSDKYDFPSAASIPPVSIMNAEPPAAEADADATPRPPAPSAAPPMPPQRPSAAGAAR